MKNSSKIIATKVQSLVLVVAMMLSFVNSAFVFTGFAEDKVPVVKTVAQVVVDNYDLDEKEAEIIASGYLKGDVYEYHLPSSVSSDELIAVDIDNQKITVDTYEDGGYVWTPSSVEFLPADGSDVTVTPVVGEEGVYTYDYEGNAFSVKVTYETEKAVAEDVQTALLNAPVNIKAGLAALEALADADSELQSMFDEYDVDGIPGLSGKMSLFDFIELMAGDGVVLYGLTVHFYNKENNKTGLPAIQATEKLSGQMDANASGKFDICNSVADYKSSASKVKYLNENAASLLAEVVEMREALWALYTANDTDPNSDAGSSIWQSFAFYADSFPVAGMVSSVIQGTLKAWIDAADEVIASGALEADYAIAEDLDDASYQELDTLVAAFDVANAKGPSVVVENSLLVATDVVSHNTSMFDVRVNVTLYTTTGVADSDVLLAKDYVVSETLTLPEGATKDDIEDAVLDAGYVNSAIAEWTARDWYVSGKYDEQVSVLPNELTEDIVYSIGYYPVEYTVTRWDGTASYPYGYVMTLEKSDDVSKAYDYTIGGKYYAEGSLYVVENDATIERKLGKAYTTSKIENVINDFYYADDEKAGEIITSGAIVIDSENKNINVRYPDNANGQITLAEGVLTAGTYPSSFKGLDWVPYSYTVVDGDPTPCLFGGSNTVTISEEDYDSIKVVYRLNLEALSADIEELINIPHTLDVEAKEQISVLGTLAGKSDQLAKLNTATLAALEVMIEELKDEFVKNALEETFGGIKKNCLEGSNLRIYNMILEYKESGLYYYYTNSEALRNEVKLLGDYFQLLFSNPDHTPEQQASIVQAVEDLMVESNLMNAEDAKEYVGKLVDLGASFEDITNRLSAPNPSIDLKNPNLKALTEILESSGSVKEYKNIDPLYFDSSEITIAAPNRATVEVTILKIGGGEVKVSKTFDKGHVLTEDDVTALIAELNSEIAKLNVDGDYYDNNSVSVNATILSWIGVAVEDAAADLAVEFTAKEFTVKIDGAADQKITVENSVITVPSLPVEEGYRFEYVIDGVKVPANSQYSFTKAQFENIFVDGVYTVIINKIDIKEEEAEEERKNLNALVDSINKNVGNNSLVFELVENNVGGASYKFVATLDLANVNGVMGAMPGAMQGFMSSGYSYIGMDGQLFYDVNNAEVSLQTVVDAMINSGFTLDDLVAAIDANGNVRNGGKLVKTTLELGANKDSAVEYPLIIAISSAPSELVEIRNLYANELKGYIGVECADGKANLALNLPTKAYEAYLGLLLITDQIDISDINAVDNKIAMGYLNDMIFPILAESDADVKTFENTLAKLGYKIDLSQYGAAYDKICAIYKDAKIDYEDDGKSASTEINVSIRGMLDSLGLGTLANMIKEYKDNSGLTIKLRATLNNIAKEYEALYVNVNAASALDMVHLVEAGKLASLKGPSVKQPVAVGSVEIPTVIVLLGDIKGDLEFISSTVLDLNGFTVDGDLICNAGVTVIDSAKVKGGNGGVTGKVSGFATLTAGKYASDVSKFVKEGYKLVDGEVVNEYYSITEDKAGKVKLELDAALWTTNTAPDIKTVVIELLGDIVLNGFTNSKLAINGVDVYAATLDDIVKLYSSVNKKDAFIDALISWVDGGEFAEIADMLVAEFTDFAELYKNIEKDAPVANFKLTVADWVLELEHKTAGDYLTFNVVAGDNESKSLDIYIVGSDADKSALLDAIGVLRDTTSVEVEISGKQTEDNGDITVNWVVGGNVEMDFSETDKILTLAVIVADGLDSAKKAEFVNAIKSGKMSALKAAFESITIKQLVDAVKAYANSDDFKTIVAKLGLETYVGDVVVDFAAKADRGLKVIAAALRKSGLSGNATKLGAFASDVNGTYVVEKQNVSRDYNAFGALGYSLILDLDVSAVKVSLKLFDAAVGGEEDDELDRSVLEALIKEAVAIRGRYTVDSWDRFEKALENAYYVYNNATTQAEIDDATMKLQNAIDRLQRISTPRPVDYTKLREAISEAESYEANKDKYTADSWERLENALIEARKWDGRSATQAKVDKVTADLRDAINGLDIIVEPLDYSALDEQIAKAEALDEADYTSSSWNALDKALADAKDVRKDADTQDEIDKATAALKEAIDKLVKLDFSKLDKLIADVEAIESTLSAEKLAILNSARNLRANANSQTDIDGAVKALEDILKKPDPDPVVIVLAIVGGVIVIGAGAFAAYYYYTKKKKKVEDNTPLVDYEAGDDK